MQRKGSLLLVVGLVALGIAAVADAIIGGDEQEDAPAAHAISEAPTAPAPSPGDELRERGVSGTLHLTRRIGGGCRYLALTLPDVRVDVDVLTPHCRVEAAPDSPLVALGSPCPSQRVEVRDESGSRSELPLRGCGPAWTADGRLTLVRDGSVVVPGRGVVLSRARFLEEIGRAPYLPRSGSYTIREAGWLDANTLVLVARHRTRAARNDFLAIFRRGRLEPAGGVYIGGTLSNVYVTRANGEIVTGGRFFWDRRGVFLRERPGVFGATAAFAGSPDGRWTASASRTAVYVYPWGEEDRPFDPVEIPIRNVIDLAWG